MRFNFLEEKKQAAVNWSRIFFTVLMAIIILLPTLHYLNLYTEQRELKRETAAIEDQLAEIRDERLEFEELKRRIEYLNILGEEIISARYYWDQVILEQGYVIPELLTLRNLEIQENGIHLSGIADNNDPVISLINQMENSDFFFNVKIEGLDRTQEVNFKLNARINGRGE